MPKRSRKEPNGTASPEPVAGTAEAPAPFALSKLQKFVMGDIPRNQLRGAPYNPRKISPEAKAKLKAVIEKVGLVQPIIWNRITGNIVGGHQRISVIDKIEGNPNYSLTVAIVDVSEIRERELNALLNNTNVGGEYDMELLRTVLDTEGLDLANTGFDMSDYLDYFGDRPGGEEAAKEQEKVREQINELEASYLAQAERYAARDDSNFYNVVIFKSHAEREAFAKEFGFTDHRYHDGRKLVEAFSALKRRVEEVELALAGAKGEQPGIPEHETKLAAKPA